MVMKPSEDDLAAFRVWLERRGVPGEVSRDRIEMHAASLEDFPTQTASRPTYGKGSQRREADPSVVGRQVRAGFRRLPLGLRCTREEYLGACRNNEGLKMKSFPHEVLPPHKPGWARWLTEHLGDRGGNGTIILPLIDPNDYDEFQRILNNALPDTCDEWGDLHAKETADILGEGNEYRGSTSHPSSSPAFARRG